MSSELPEEIRHQINLIYRRILRRRCDSSGMLTYGTLLMRGASIDEIESILKRSDEYALVLERAAGEPKRLPLDRDSKTVDDPELRSRVDFVRAAPGPRRGQFDGSKMRIHWVMPDFGPASGGHTTIFRVIRALEALGHSNVVWICNPSFHGDDSGVLEDVARHYPLVSAEFRLVDERFDSATGDVIFATDWASVGPVCSSRGFLRRFYFVQDHEAEFHGRGSLSLAAESTYHEDLDCICAGPWLESLLRRRYKRWAKSFWLAADQSIYHVGETRKPKPGKFRIAFYARMSSPRRSVELGLLAFEVMARRGADFEVHCFGEHLDLEAAPFDCTCHGVLGHERLAELYRSCDLGIVLSTTNYSLVPKEMMASGLPVAELDQECTRAIFPGNVAFFLSPDPLRMADQLIDIIDDDRTRRGNASRALEWVNRFSWENAARSVEQSLRTRLAELGFTDSRAESEESARADATVKATIVIPTLDGGALFRRVIHRALEQLAPWRYEILVIDSGSTDGTVEFIRTCPGIRLQQIDQSSFQHGRTRNLAFELAQGEFVAFLTQDALPRDRYWLGHIVTLLERYPDAAGAFGRHRAYPHAGPFTRRDIDAHFDSLERWPMRLSRQTDEKMWLSGDIQWRQLLHFFSDNNSCIRRSAWEQIPFPEVDFGEDQAWAWRAIDAGYEKIYAGQAAVYHSHDYDPPAAQRRAYEEARFFANEFGYRVTDPADLETEIASRNQDDRIWASMNGVSDDALAARLEFNRAWVTGMAEGVGATFSDKTRD